MVYAKKTYRQQYYLLTVLRRLTPFTEERWSKFFLPTTYQKTVAAIMMLYRNTKVKVRSPDGDTDYFDIVAGALQGDTLAPYVEHLLIKIKENGFMLTKKKVAEDTPQKQLPTLKPKPCYIVWNKLLQALASISMHTRRNICTLIKQMTSPH